MLLKFVCNEIKQSNAYTSKELVKVTLHPISRVEPGSENQQAWPFVASGMLELDALAPVAAEQFQIGKEYMLSILPVTGK